MQVDTYCKQKSITRKGKVAYFLKKLPLSNFNCKCDCFVLFSEVSKISIVKCNSIGTQTTNAEDLLL